ncbi:MAG: hypothetical protein KBF25_05855 [Chitinophagaceae bacterium]|nr:hypothetical protein [Chitinophagaceae bacterium]
MKQLFAIVFAMGLYQTVDAQSAYMKHLADDQFLIERLDVLNGRLSDSLYTSLQSMSRKEVVQFLEQYLQKHRTISPREKEEIMRIISKNGEWAANGEGAEDSKYPILNRLYQKKSDMINVHVDQADLVINPIFNYQQMVETNNTKQNLFLNSKGIELRANLNKRIGVYSTFTDNQERGPWHHQQRVSERSAVPGMGYYKDFKVDKPGLAQDYLYAAGYLDAEVIKNKVNVAFGQDRFHLGDGYRSLFLNDMGANYLFMKINTKFWKFNYQNLWMELTPQYSRGGDKLLPRKYAAMHYLSANVTKWLNISLFEGVVFGRQDHFDFRYMNPIILYRSVEQNAGSPDNAMLGMGFKINTKIKTVLYGQVLLDEFKFSEIMARNGWWANKYGIQLGFKVADLFNIKNLLIQGEANMVRPFTYSRDSVSNFTHYNQPLAHPYGANFLEANFIVNYKPMRNVHLSWRSFINRQGRDTSAKRAFGGDIFKSYKARNDDYGIGLFNGYPTETFYTNLNLSYELRYNIFFDLGFAYRYQNTSTKYVPAFNSLQVYSGIRVNAVRRQYDY